MSGELETVQAWFDAFGRSDLDAARKLYAEHALLEPAGARGFDDALRWYEGKRETEGPDFAYNLIALLPGAGEVAAVIELRNARRRWLQVALYRIEKGRITSVRLFEEP